MLGGRVKTLHPRVHGGILADRSNPEHVADMEREGFGYIDLVVVNLYPFLTQPAIETIDIGGPTMIRSAAKNHAHVAVLTDPAAYPGVLGELQFNQGTLGIKTRRQLALDAFAHTAAFDAAVVRLVPVGRAGRPGPRRRPRPPARPAAHAGAGGRAALRREPAPAGGPLPGGRRGARVPRRGRPARRQGAVVHQRPRRRVGLPHRVGLPRRAGLRDRQARQPLRGRHRRRPARGLPAGVRLRLAVGVRRGRRLQPPRLRGRGRGGGRRLHRGRGGARLRGRRHRAP